MNEERLIYRTLNGREVRFDINRHLYFVDNIEYPSVTTILNLLDKSIPLMYWAVERATNYLEPILKEIEEGKRILSEAERTTILKEAKQQHRKIKEEAATIGSKTHRAIEKDLEGKEYDIIPEIQTPFSAYISWKESFTNFEPIDTEIITFSDSKCRFCGTADAVIKLNGKTYLVDLKTSSGIYESYLLQLCSYKFALEENNNHKIEGIGILRLDKNTGMPEWVEFSKKQYTHGLKSFMHLCKLFHEMNIVKTLLEK